MSTRDGTAEPVSRDQILRHARGQGSITFPVQLTTDWQPYPVDPYSAICDDHTYIKYYDRIYLQLSMNYLGGIELQRAFYTVCML